MRTSSISDRINAVARDASVRGFRAYLAEDYDGIGQYVLISLARAAPTSALRARVAAGDFATAQDFPVGTPVVVFSHHGSLEILSLGVKP